MRRTKRLFNFCLFAMQNFLFGHINGQVPELCFNLYGCRVIQCILECGTVTHRSAIFNSLMMDPMPLIQDRYGNYVIQYALRTYNPSLREKAMQMKMKFIVKF